MLKPIGEFKSLQRTKSETPRQPYYTKICDPASVDADHILLHSKAAALLTKGLAGFSHLYVIFLFNNPSTLKTLVRPPSLDYKVGILATRSPHRPNPIGLSILEILKVEPPKIFVKNSDLLNGTEILDIKPYVSFYDAIPNAKNGWLENAPAPLPIEWTPLALQEVHRLKKDYPNLQQAIVQNLEYQPRDGSRKRIKKVSLQRADLPGAFVAAIQELQMEKPQVDGIEPQLDDFYVFSFKYLRIFYWIAGEKVIVLSIVNTLNLL